MVALAFAGDPDRAVAIFPDNRAPTHDATTAPRADRYAGAVDAAPVADWTVRLPGPRPNSPTRTERSRPVVVGDQILVGSASAPGLFVLSRTDGSVIRKFPSRASVASAPTVAGDRVYFADTGGTVHAYTFDGAELWSRYVGSAVLTPPTLDHDQLFVATVADLALALDVATGDLQWQYQRPTDPSRSTELALYARPQPVVVDRTVLCGFSDGSLVALDVSRGDISWERSVGEGRYPDLVAAPIAAGTDVFASGYFAPLVAIDRKTLRVRWRVDHGSASPPALWTDADGQVVLLHPGTDGTLRAIVALTGELRWSWDSGSTGALTTPQITPAGVMLGSSEGGLWLVDPATGTTAWTYDEDQMLEGLAVEPTIAGRQVLFVTNAGRLHSMVVPKKTTPFDDRPFARVADGPR